MHKTLMTVILILCPVIFPSAEELGADTFKARRAALMKDMQGVVAILYWTAGSSGSALRFGI